MGRYSLARKALLLALEQHETTSEPLPAAVLSETRAFLEEIDRLLARLVIHLEPTSAAIAIDGRPLELQPSKQGRPLLLAGVLPPGRGVRPPSADFDVLLDPGAHVISLSRPGYRDSIVNRTLDPGSNTRLELVIERLPATLLVDADQAGAIVRVDGADVGIAPVTVVRPGGSYRVAVDKHGFLPYESQASVGAGEQLRIRANLRLETPAITERWWFWGAVSTVVAGAIVGTYYATRPEPTRPEPDGGSLGWVVVAP